MTCIIGLEHENKVYMGCDSLSTDGWTKQTITNRKIFKHGEFIIGVSGYPRFSQVMQYLTPFPKQVEIDDFSFICQYFVESIRETMDKYKVGNIDDNGANFGDSIALFGYRGKLYLLDSNYQINNFSNGYTAIGTGASVALGSMFALKNLKPKQRILESLKASAHFDVGVSKPFYVECI